MHIFIYIYLCTDVRIVLSEATKMGGSVQVVGLCLKKWAP